MWQLLAIAASVFVRNKDKEETLSNSISQTAADYSKNLTDYVDELPFKRWLAARAKSFPNSPEGTLVGNENALKIASEAKRAAQKAHADAISARLSDEEVNRFLIVTREANELTARLESSVAQLTTCAKDNYKQYLAQKESEELILRNKQAVEAAEQARKLEIEAGERQRVKLADRTAASLPSVEEALKKARDAAKL